MNDRARTIRMQHCAAIRRTLQRILDNPAAGFETWFSKTTLAGLTPPSRMTDRELSMARHTLTQSRTRFMEEASMPTRQPAPAAFVPGGLQALVDMTGQPAMYGDTEVLPKVAPAAATMAQGGPDAAFAQFCDREGYPSDGPFDAALRKAFDAGRAAHPPADAAPVDAEQAARSKWTVKQWYEHVGAWENLQGEVCFGSVMALGAMLKLMAKARHAAQPAPARDDALDAARWQFMVEVSAGPPALNTYAATLNEQPFILHETPATRKATFIAAVDKARQKMAEQQTQEGGAE